MEQYPNEYENRVKAPLGLQACASGYADLLKRFRELEADRDSLFEYVCHLPDCPKFSVPFNGKCDCGLDEILNRKPTEEQ